MRRRASRARWEEGDWVTLASLVHGTGEAEARPPVRLGPSGGEHPHGAAVYQLPARSQLVDLFEAADSIETPVMHTLQHGEHRYATRIRIGYCYADRLSACG